MTNKITNLTKINIEEYRQRNPKFHIIIKRISETEAFLINVSPCKFSKSDLCDENLTNGFKPESLEIIPALVPDISFEFELKTGAQFPSSTT